MKLNKTIYNIKNSKTRFYNIPLGRTIYLDVLKDGICFTDSYIKNSFIKKIYYKKYQVFNQKYFVVTNNLSLGKCYLGDSDSFYIKIYFTE